MQIVQSVTWLPAPGRTAETIAAFATAKKLHEAHGAKVRGFTNLVAGTNSGQLIYTLAHDGWERFAKFGQALQADAEWQALWANLQGANPMATMESHVIARVVEETKGAVPAGAGPHVRSARGYAFDPARRDEALALLTAQKKIVEGLGGHVRITQLQYGGTTVNRMAAVHEYADMTAFAARRAKYEADTAFQASLAKLGAAGSPLTLMFAALNVELPI